jgi:hypothetical protein
MQKRDVLNSPRLQELKRHRHRAILNKILISGLGFLAIFILSVYLSHLKSLNISDVEIVGNKVVDTDAIKTRVQKEIAGKYLWLFPKTNILIYPEASIEKQLKSKFQRIKDISLSLKDNKILEVSLTEREAKYTWCGTTTNQDQCYFLDEDGYIFDKAPYFSGEVYFKFYGSGNVGSYFFKQNFQPLVSFKDILIGIGLKPVALYITPDGDVEVFLSGENRTGVGPYITFKIDADFQNIAENLEAALTTEPLQSEFKNKYSSLQYIDLRFGNKVYYKFQ